MRTLNIRFEDKDFNIIIRAKNESGLPWEDFILNLVKGGNGNNGNNGKTKD